MIYISQKWMLILQACIQTKRYSVNTWFTPHGNRGRFIGFEQLICKVQPSAPMVWLLSAPSPSFHICFFFGLGILTALVTKSAMFLIPLSSSTL